MQFRGLLLLGILLGAEAAQLDKRQDASSSDDGSAGSTVVDVVTSTTTSASPTSTSQSPTQGGGTTSASDNSGGSDTTVTQTTTVTNKDASSVTVKTTVFTTITSTIVVTSTAFQTTTVTSSDAETATKTVYETTTSWANMRRALDLAPRTVGPEDFEVDAYATEVPSITKVHVHDLEMIRHKERALAKRDTVTVVVTVTAGSGNAKTVTSAQTKTVISTVSSQTKVTSTVTETEEANAKTTVTVTSTLTVTSTAVTTGVVETETVAPSGSYGSSAATATGGSSSSGSSSGSSGLSTGAKAGIGAGCGVAGLVIIAGLIWFCVRSRRNREKPDPDDMFGSSEVPVGPSGGSGMTSQHNRDVAAAIISPRPAPTKPSSPEGYRGTARGDGRAGFAKPEVFGSAYTPSSPETMYTRTTGNETVSPNAVEMQSPANTAELASDSAATRWHENDAAEIDGAQVHSMRGTAPPQNVYEMPAQDYR